MLMGMDAQAAELERLIEDDPTLRPAKPSALLVAPAVLEPEEVSALLSGLSLLLHPNETDPFEEKVHEPDTAATRRDRGHPQLSPFAWLFPDHAGTGRPARHQQ